MLNYEPRPDSVAAHTIAYLQQHGPTRSTVVAHALDKRAADMYAFLKAAFGHNAILAAGDGARVRVLYLPGQDYQSALDAALAASPRHRSGAAAGLQDPSTAPKETARMSTRKTRTPRPALPETDAQAPLQMASWSDGDTVIQGDSLQFVTGTDGDITGVIFSRDQLRQLVDFVARPVVALS